MYTSTASSVKLNLPLILTTSFKSFCILGSRALASLDRVGNGIYFSSVSFHTNIIREVKPAPIAAIGILSLIFSIVVPPSIERQGLTILSIPLPLVSYVKSSQS